jgi:hypothetical protein
LDENVETGLLTPCDNKRVLRIYGQKKYNICVCSHCLARRSRVVLRCIAKRKEKKEEERGTQ